MNAGTVDTSGVDPEFLISSPDLMKRIHGGDNNSTMTLVAWAIM